jgi:hypothetical protein
MNEPRKNSLPLEYSSPAQDHRRETEEEQKRREALETYNESTFGERRPFAAPPLRYLAFFLVIVLIAFLLPRRAFYPLAIAATVVYHYLGWRASR